MCLRVPGLATDVMKWIEKLRCPLLSPLEMPLVRGAAAVQNLLHCAPGHPDWRAEVDIWLTTREVRDNPPEVVQDLLQDKGRYWQLAAELDNHEATSAGGRELLRQVVYDALVDEFVFAVSFHQEDENSLNWVLSNLADQVVELQRWRMKGGESFTAKAETLAEFLARPKQQDYLVKGVLAAGQLAVIGGPEKGMKSNIAIDLAVSLAAGAKFLGRFEVPRPRKVLVLTGETRDKPLENLLRRVLAGKGLHEDALPARLALKEDLPSLNNPDDLAILGGLIKSLQAEVVILDPLYFALGPGPEGRPVNLADISQVGRLMLNAANVCVAAGATPVFVHHMSKGTQLLRSQGREAMQLSDLTGAGIGPVARQWLLISYLEPYDPNAGSCKVWLSIGGSAGHGGLHVVSIDEGVFEERLPLNGRRWQVSVQSGPEAVRAANQLKQAAAASKKAQLAGEDQERVLQVLRPLTKGETQAELARLTAIPRGRVASALFALMQECRVAKTRVVKAAGRNPSKSYEGWRNIQGVGRNAQQGYRLSQGEYFEDVFPPPEPAAEGQPTVGQEVGGAPTDQAGPVQA
jgi:hypothetical protein